MLSFSLFASSCQKSLKINTHTLMTHYLTLPSVYRSLLPPRLSVVRSLSSDTHEVRNTSTTTHQSFTRYPSFRDSLSSKEPTEHRDESRKKREGQRLFLHEKRKKEKKRRIGKLGHKRPVGPGDANLCFIRFLFSFSLYLSCTPSSVVFVNRDFPEPSKGITRQAVSQASFWVPRASRAPA